MGVVPKKSESRSDQATTDDRQLSRSRQITDKKIISDQQMARSIRHQRINKRYRDRAPDRQAIDAIGQIDRIARSGDDQKKEGKENPQRHRSQKRRLDRKSTRLNPVTWPSRMPSSA